MSTAAKLRAVITHFHNADNIAVLFAEKCGSAAVFGFLKAHLTNGDIRTVENCVIDGILDRSNLLRSHCLKVRKVKSQIVGIDK